MKKYSKKIALILALSLILAIGIPTLAAEQTVITGRYKAPEIDVVLPSNTDAIINPYGLPVEITADDSTPIPTKITGNQIVTAKPLAGFNYGEIDLDIGATVIGETANDFTLSPEAPDAESTRKTGLVYFEINDNETNPLDLGYTTTPDAKTIGFLDGDKIATALNGWTSEFTGEEGADNQVLVSARDATKNGMTTLKAVDENGAIQNESYFLARLSGDIVKAPSEEWVAADGVDVTITWILEPASEEPDAAP